MFKYVVFAAVLAVAFAAPEPQPGLVAPIGHAIASPIAYTGGYAAPVAYSGYSANYAAPVVRPAAYAAPYAYSGGYAGAPVAYSYY